MNVSAMRGGAHHFLTAAVVGRTAGRVDDGADVGSPEGRAVFEAWIGEELRVADGVVERVNEREEKTIRRTVADAAERIDSGLRQDRLHDIRRRSGGKLFQTKSSHARDERCCFRGSA